ncbi:MAG TPA: hypothetical protein DEH78_24830, partial [Solibacterales bacterium]|nr:hypothetical protein [Bryobacterales bacterium]
TEDERPYVDFGVVAAQHRNWRRAEEIAALGLAKAAGSARLHSLRGTALFQLGRTEEALRAFDEADRLAPRLSLGAAGQGVLLTDQSRPEEAAAALRAGLARRPGDPVLSYLLADALLRARPEERAEPRELLEAAVKAKPEFARAHALLGKLYRAGGRPQEAIRALRLALAQDGRNRQALQQLVIALREAGRAEESAEAAERLRTELAARAP